MPERPRTAVGAGESKPAIVGAGFVDSPTTSLTFFVSPWYEVGEVEHQIPPDHPGSFFWRH